ncbi:MAG: hypothetical protein IPH97_17600 [Ignavibacteriales bacterium]|nr:hypothetical protein [Ignavibacteriales bacterium]
MKNVIRNFIAIIFFCLLCFNSCSKDNNPIDSNCNFDSNLVGEWYLVDSLNLSFPSPDYNFQGFQINKNQTMIPLGIETSTGKVAISQYPRIDSIISAINGKIVIKYAYKFYAFTDTLHYNINGNRIVIGDQNYSQTYIKTSLNTLLFNPINSDVAVKIDTVYNNNMKVFNFPSAYLSKKTSSDILIIVNFYSSYITVGINNFNGVGVYSIPFQKAEYSIFDTDMVIRYLSDSTSSATFIVEQYDEISNICSGTFSFDAYEGFYMLGPKIEIRNGTFTVPIYK